MTSKRDWAASRPQNRPQPIWLRLLRHRQIDAETGCWNWTGRKLPNGYGRIGERGYTHRVVYEAIYGAIPAGLVIDHLCRNRACFNPDHLEVVTQRENTHRGDSPTAKVTVSGKCRRGHDFSGDNLWVSADGLTRHCRQCWAVRREERRVVAA